MMALYTSSSMNIKWKLNKVRSHTCLVILLLLFNNIFLISQRPANVGQGGGGGRPNQQNVLSEDNGPDTTIYEYVLTDDIFRKTPRVDTLADISFMKKNMLIPAQGDFVNTGNFGSAVYPLIYKTEINSGFNTGYNQYGIYKISLNNFRFYEQNRPISDLYFSQLSNQENINVRADFSRNFSDGLSLSVNYLRISQKGFYTGQDTKSTAFGIGMRYKSKSEKYNAFLIFIHNANQEGHIGGIINPDDLNERFKKDISVILSEANTRQQERNLSFVQYYKLTGSKDKGFRLYLKNDIQYKPSYYHFSDVNINDNNDSTFYNGITLDKRGLRRYTSVSQISNGFFINGDKTNGLSGRVGLIVDYFSIKDGLENQNRLDLTALIDGSLPILGSLRLETKGKLGLAKNIGNFDIEGKLNFDVKKIGTLSGFLKIFRSENAYNSYKLVINDVIERENTFVNPLGTEIGGNLWISTINMNAGLSQSVINNPIYWGKDGNPYQYDGVFTSTYLHLQQNFKTGHFHLDNHIHFQVFNTNLYPLPKLYSTHQLYYTGAWFQKVMNVTLGIDAKLIPDYQGPGFQPLYGQFHLTDSSLPFFPAANLYLQARVSSFRAMLLMENFSQYFFSNTNFDVVGQPQFDPKFRFGIQWLLKD